MEISSKLSKVLAKIGEENNFTPPAYITPNLTMSINNIIDLHVSTCRELLLNKYLVALAGELSRKGIVTGSINNNTNTYSGSYANLLDSNFIVELTIRLAFKENKDVNKQIVEAVFNKLHGCWIMTKKILKAVLTSKDYYLTQKVLEESIVEFKNTISVDEMENQMRRFCSQPGGRPGTSPLSAVGKFCYDKDKDYYIANVTDNQLKQPVKTTRVKFRYDSYNGGYLYIPIFGLNYTGKSGQCLISLYHVFGVIRNIFLYMINLLMYRNPTYLVETEKDSNIELFSLCQEFSNSTKMDRRRLLYAAVCHLGGVSNKINMDRTGLVIESYKSIIRNGLVFKDIFVNMIDPRGYKVATQGGSTWETLRSQLSYKKFARLS